MHCTVLYTDFTSILILHTCSYEYIKFLITVVPDNTRAKGNHLPIVNTLDLELYLFTERVEKVIWKKSPQVVAAARVSSACGYRRVPLSSRASARSRRWRRRSSWQNASALVAASVRSGAARLWPADPRPRLRPRLLPHLACTASPSCCDSDSNMSSAVPAFVRKTSKIKRKSIHSSILVPDFHLREAE